MEVKVALAGTCLLMAVFVPACGQSEEKEYLEEARAAWRLSEARFESFQETMDQTLWQDTGQLFQTLIEEGAGTAYDATLGAIEELDPPNRFVTDHDRMLRGLRDLVALDQTIGRSLATEDLEAFVLGNSGLGEANKLMSLELSPDVCEAAVGHYSYRCDRPDPLPGGEYGSELYGIIGRFAAQFESRTRGVFIPALSLHEDEALEILSKLQPEVADIVEQTLARVRQLVPPAELQTDHDRLLRYLEEELQEAQSMPMPSNIPLPAAPPPAGGETPMDSAYCKAKRELSSAMQPIVRFYFGDDSGLCEGGNAN